jgi:hypothetical protein
VLSLGLQAHFAASYLVPLDGRARGGLLPFGLVELALAPGLVARLGKRF